MRKPIHEHQASPELATFFDRLLELKAQIKEMADETEDEYLLQIYDTLHNLIKEA